MIKQPIPIFRLEFEDGLVRRFQEGCADILRSGRPLSNGHYVHDFEGRFAHFIGARYAVAVSSGTAALEVALRALEVQDRTVLIPTNTFIATAIAVQQAGANLVLGDIEDSSFALNPTEVERWLDRADLGAVVLVHIGGSITRHAAWIKRMCEEKKVPLVEDAAQAHGAAREGLRAGTIGSIGCFSFFPTKVMTTGEGGMCTTNDEHLAWLMRSIRDFGRDPLDGTLHILDGANFKMTEFQGLLGLLELDRVQHRINMRRTLANYYIAKLAGTAGYRPSFDPEGSAYKLILRTRLPPDRLKTFCSEHDVALTGGVYYRQVHRQPRYAGLAHPNEVAVAEEFARTHICPPLYPELSLAEVDRVCDVLKVAEARLP